MSEQLPLFKMEPVAVIPGLADFEIDKAAGEVVEAMLTPVIVYPGGWGNDVPQDMVNRACGERLAAQIKGQWGELATIADTAIYLMTASLAEPLTSRWTDIYGWVIAEMLPKTREVTGLDIPDQLGPDEKRDLEILRRKLRQKQRQIWVDKQQRMKKGTKK